MEKVPPTNNPGVLEVESPDVISSELNGTVDKHNWFETFRYKVNSQTYDEANGEPDIVAVGKDFCSRTTSQGITQVFHAPEGSKRIFWISLTFIALALLIGHLYYLINTFMLFETSTEVTIVPAKLLEFPAVTVCNNNMVKALPVVPEFDIPGAFAEQFDEVADYLTMNNSNNGHQKEDLIEKAIFDNHFVDIEKDFILTMNARYGNCYTFNMNGTRKTRRAMPGYGLELWLNIEHYAYDTFEFRPAEWVGAIVKIHDKNIEPTPQEGGIVVAPGTLNRLTVTKTKFVRKGGVYGNCFNPEDYKPATFYTGKYTKQHCDNTCLQKEIITKCCCHLKIVKYDLSNFTQPWRSLPEDRESGLSNWTTCQKESIGACVDNDTCWKTIWERYDNGSLSCQHCWDTCNETKYDTRLASVPWPADAYIDRIASELEQNERLMTQLFVFDQINQTEISDEILKENFLSVEILYETLTTTFVTERPAISTFEFVSEIGGTFGLWIGWTILTIFEFFEFVSDLIVVRFRKRR
ncbi:hypothetical protein EB796_008241 [Bugula neritina]|uniref:SCNN1D n=1 Tax=Bugula neritina TaxID=10212 RepID=A0A7J7K497_BUGNE|nr:hypothetical protein EB796_008241 [Bugula neritina]